MRDRLWAMSRSLGALMYILVLGALVFIPAFLIIDRWPTKRLIRLYEILSAVCLLLAVAIVMVTIQSGVWDRGTVLAAYYGFFALIAAALGLFRAAMHGEETRWTKPTGEPKAHWLHSLEHAPHWWLRSRAARELEPMAGDPAVVAALRASLERESNRHVRGAVGAGLARA